MIALSWLLLADPASGAEAARRYALLVGANDGGNDRVTLRYAHSDAQAMGDVLTELGGVDPGDRTVLLDPNAMELRQALTQLADAVATAPHRAEIIFYYSGHSDAEGLMLGGEHFSYAELRRSLEELPSDVKVAVLDSCSSGALIRSKGGRRIKNFLDDESNEVAGFSYITSSSADEVSQEADQIGGSFFTHSLTTGMRGAADQSGDGRVTLDEAYSFAYETTLARTERTVYGPQHANREHYLSGKGNVVLTDLHLTSASLVLAEELKGRALVRDEDGDLVAELIKPGGRMIELGLGAGSYEITFGDASDGRFALAQIRLEVGTTAIVTPEDLVWYEAEEAIARGDAAAPPQAVVAPAPPTPVRPHPPRFELTPGFPPPLRDAPDSMIFGVMTHSRAVDGAAFAFAGTLVDDDLKGINFALGTSIVGGNLYGTQGTLGFNLVRGTARGPQLTLGANVAGELQGPQLSLGGNWVRGPVDGVQLTLGVNAADGGLKGIQGALGANLSLEDVRGIQGSLGANVASGSLRGFQGSLGANIAAGDVRGFQGTLDANIAAGDVTGVQGSLGLNVAREVGGVQVGGVNVARDVRGSQVGFVNVGREVRGLQVGLVNVARKVDGVAIGLLTFEREGRHDLLVYASETDWLNAEFKLGSRYFHTVFGVGGQPGDHAWLGLGWGAHVPMGRLWLDIDGIAQSYVQPSRFQSDTGFLQWPDAPATFVTRGRVTLGAQILQELAAFGGVSVAVQPGAQTNPLAVAPGSPDDRTSTLIWPGIFAGLQF